MGLSWAGAAEASTSSSWESLAGSPTPHIPEVSVSPTEGMLTYPPQLLT